MYCPHCGRDNRAGAAFCDGCGRSLGGSDPARGAAFIGRRDELQIIHEALTQARNGEGRLLLVRGEPGIGKTRLAQEAASRAAELNFQVLWGRCLEDPGAPPYWPWLQILRGWLEKSDSVQVAEGIGEDAGLLLDLAPELGRHIPGLKPAPSLTDPTQARFRLFDAVVRVWQRVAQQQPLLLILDNLHAADAASLRLLEFVAPELAASRLLVLGTYRDTALSPRAPLSNTLGEVVRQPRTRRISLSGLHRREADSLLLSLSGQPATPGNLAAAIYSHSEGNPLFIRELTQSLLQQGLFSPKAEPPQSGIQVPIPEGIREVLRQRFMRLSTRCNNLLATAAVVGRTFELELLLTVADDLDATSVLEALDEALNARLIEKRAQLGRFQFSHSLLRETLYEELSAARRLDLHRRVGRQLAMLHGRDSNAHLPRIAYHFAQAAPLGSAPEAVTYAAQAGARADALLAYEEAVQFYTLATELQSRYAEGDSAERYRLLLALGTAQCKAGEYVQAMATFKSAAGNAEDRGAAADLSLAALGYEDANWRPGLRGATACELLWKAELAIGSHPSRLKARVLSALTRALIFTGDLETATEVQARAVAMARALNDPAILAAALRAGLSARWQAERLQERLSMAREVIALAKQVGDWERVFEGLSWQLFDLLEAADMRAMWETLEYHTQLGQELRQPFFSYIGVSFRAALALLEGHFDASEKYARDALALGRRQGLDAVGVFSLQMFSIERERGRLDVFEPVLERFLNSARTGAVWRPGLALLYCELGRLDAARKEFEHLATDDFAAVPRDGLWVTCLAYLAEVCAALGDADRANRLYQYLNPYAGRNIVTGTTVACYGSADRFLGLLAAALDNTAAAARHFENAITLDERSGARPFLARGQYHLAALLLSQEAGSQRAVTLLHNAQHIANQIGMKTLAEQTARLLQQVATGHPAQGNAAGLSRRELDVLRLIADGRSNRDIAEHLFVSPNTVANHVRNILSKTGTSNRTEAAAYARQRRLLEP